MPPFTLTDAALRGRRGTALAVLLVLAVAVVGTAWFLAQRDRVAQRQALDAAEAALADAAVELTSVTSAAGQVLDSSAHMVEDEQLRTDLTAALAEADALPTGPATDGSVPERTRAAEQRRTAVLAQSTAVQDAAARVAGAYGDRVLDLARIDHASAVTALTAALGTAEAAAAAGTGTPGTRGALATALADARAARDATTDQSDVDALLAATERLGSARTALDQATRAVTG